MASPPAPAETSAAARWACLLTCGFFVASRAPRLIFEPRLWAEEASVYLAHACSHGVLSSLLLVPTASGPSGYFNLPANLAATLSVHLFAPEQAAAVALAVAFLLQLLPFALVLWGRSRFWSSPARRVVVCALFLFAPPVRPDVWLSPINSQVFCGIAGLVILTEDLRGAGRRRLWIYRAILLFCGLSGAYVGLLLLPFLLRAFLARCSESRIQAYLVGLCVVIQLALYLTTALVVPGSAGRFVNQPWAAMPTIVLLDHVVQPIVGGPVVERALPRGPLADNLRGALPDETWESPLAGLLSLALTGAFWWWLSRRRTDPFYRLLPLSFAVVAGGMSVLAFGLPRRRYAVLSGLVLLLGLLVAGWSEVPASRRRKLSRILVAISLVAGVSTFWLEVPWYRQGQPVSNFGSFPGRPPDWREEISRWRQDSRYRVRTWPYTSELSWSTLLTTATELHDLQATFYRFGPIRLRNGHPQQRVPVDRLPAEVRLRLHGRSENGGDAVQLEIALEDGRRQKLTAFRITGFEAGRSFTKDIQSSRLRLAPEEQLRAIRWRLIGPLRQPTALTIDRIEVLPAKDGLFDVLARRLF